MARKAAPYFDDRRNAWITRAGGKLTTLAKGPKNARSEAEATLAFHRHMATLGHSPAEHPATELLIGELADEYDHWMQREVAAGRMAQSTADYYRRYIQRFLDTVGGRRPVSSLKKIELEQFKTSWHSVQSVQRLFNFGEEFELIDRNPFRGVKRPPAGRRQRTLSRDELAQMVKASDQAFGHFLLALRRTIARPQELRSLQWCHLHLEPVPQFILTEFKSKRLRRDQDAVRRIALDDWMVRMLSRWADKRQPDPSDFVFLNKFGQPWSSNAVRLRMKRLRTKLGIEADENGEVPVAYTVRHTAASTATRNGTQQKVLSELLGHTSIATTERYQHSGAEHLNAAIRNATKRQR